MRNWIPFVQSYWHAFLHLFYPHICLQCGNDNITHQQVLCSHCENLLPYTHFGSMQNNPIEKIFWGRALIKHASSILFFTKESIVQKIIIELKYHQNKKAGLFLGKLIAESILSTNNNQPFDYIVPIPIRKSKLRSRGYNQSMVICEGMLLNGLNVPIFTGLLKSKNTITQTQKDRLQRGAASNTLFNLTHSNQLNNKHLLIVDDVITTGATLEAACNCLLLGKPASISIITAAYTLH